MSQRVRHIAFCTTMTKCDDDADCERLDRGMEQLGFQPRSSEVRAGCCVRGYVQECADGKIEQVRDCIAEQLPVVAFGHIAQWRAFVQICGNDAAWATLSAGRPAVRGSTAEKPWRRMNGRTQLAEHKSAVALLSSSESGAGSAGERQEGTAMSMKNGPIIHVERGYQIAEVIEELSGAKQFIGYRLVGPGAADLPVFATEEQALRALAQLAAQRPDPATE